jgi:hypothetical protein
LRFAGLLRSMAGGPGARRDATARLTEYIRRGN